MSFFGSLSNRFCSNPQKGPGFEMPQFLSKRAISEYDAPELQQLFAHNSIIYFRELTDEMLRSFLKYSYPKGIYIIELLGLYGVNFLTEKTKRYSEPHTNDYRLLKFDRDTTEIFVKYNTKYEEEIIGLKRYLSDMRLSTSFLLDGIKIDVLLNHLNIPEDVFKEIFSYELYPEDALNEIYPTFKKKTTSDFLAKKELDENQQEYVFSDQTTNQLEEARSELFGEGTIEPTITQKIPSYIADIKLPRPEFSVRLSNSLRNGNITCVKDLLHISKNELLKLPNFGQKCLKELEEYLKTENVFLDGPYIIIEKEDPHGKSDEAITQEIPSYIADIKLPRPEFSVRLSNSLRNGNITCVKDLLHISKNELLKLPNFGQKCLKELEEYLKTENVFLDVPYIIIEKEDSHGKSDEAITQEIPSYIADIKLPRPEFSVRLSNALSNNNISCIKELLGFLRKDLLRLPNFGRKSLSELEEYLKTENVFLEVPYVIVEKEDPHEKSGKKFDLLFQQIQNLERKLDDEDRKKDVYEARIKNRDKITLQKLADDYSVSRERIRQLEVTILKNLEKILLDYMDSFTSVFEKFGSLISYKDVDELKLLKDYDVVLKNTFEFKEDFPFFIDLTLGLLILKDFEFEEIFFDGGNSACISYSEIEDEIRQRISSSLKRDTQEAEANFNRVLQKIVEYNIENNFIFDANRKGYLSKTSSLETERIQLAFKELYPSGIHIFQKIDEIFEKLKSHDPMIECSTERALEARLVNNENIIMTNRGFYQHIDTIKVDPNVIAFASEECKKKLQKEGSPFQISVIFEENKDFFERNGVFSEYLLFSLLKRFNDPSLFLRRLLVYKRSEEVLKFSDCFEEYFKSHKGIIPIEEVKNHFNSLGWDSFSLSNQLSNSSNIFKISTGYFHKDNLYFNKKSFSRLMEKIHADINECGFSSLDEIRKKNFVDWLGVLNQEDLDTRSMVSIIKAYCPEFPYEVSSTGVISNGNKLNSSEVLYQWITQKCERENFVVAKEIMEFCDEKGFNRYNTKNLIKDSLAEVSPDCIVSYDYLGLSKNDAQKIVERIMDLFKGVSSPYITMLELIEKLDLPQLSHIDWNEYLIRSIIENVGGIIFYGFIVINPYQQKITKRDQVVANELNIFTHSWFMEAGKLESLLRRKKVFGKNETFSHKGIQNELFGEDSCLEKRDQDKNVCIKREYRDSLRWQNTES